MSTPTPLPSGEWYPQQQQPYPYRVQQQPHPYPYPYPVQQRPAPGRYTIHYGFSLLAIFSLLGTVIPTVIMFAAAGSTASDKSLDHESASAAAGMGSGMAILWLLWGGNVDPDLGRVRYQPHAEGTTRVKKAITAALIGGALIGLGLTACAPLPTNGAMAWPTSATSRRTTSARTRR